MTIIVWSKAGCGYCDQAKMLLKQKGLVFEERNISQGPYSKEDLLEAVPTARTLPQIVIDGECVGGFTELKARLK